MTDSWRQTDVTYLKFYKVKFKLATPSFRLYPIKIINGQEQKVIYEMLYFKLEMYFVINQAEEVTRHLEAMRLNVHTCSLSSRDDMNRILNINKPSFP